MSSIDCIVDVDIFSKWLGLQTKSSKDCINSKIREWSSDEKKLTGLSTRFRRFKQEMKKDIDSLKFWADELEQAQNFVPRRGLTWYCKKCPFDKPCSKWANWSKNAEK